MSDMPTAPPVEATIDAAYRTAWRAFVANFWPLMGGMLLYVTANVPPYVMGLVAQAADNYRHGAGLPFAFLGNAYSFFVIVPLGFGLLRLHVRTMRGEGVVYGHLLEPFRSVRMYLSSLGATLLTGCIALAVMAPGIALALVSGCGAILHAASGRDEAAVAQALAAAGVGLALSAVVMAVPLMWIGTRLVFVNPCVSDGGANPVEAVARSWEMTRGHAVTVLLLLLSAVPLMIAGCAACCVGFVPALSLVYLAQASLYLALGGFSREARAA